jgi:hypothetical protein
MLVEMPEVRHEQALEMAAAENQQPVETLPTDGPNPALGMGARLRRPHRRLDHSDAFRAEDLVERAAELAVAVAEEKPRPDALIVELHQQVARLLSHPATIRIGGDAGNSDAASRQLDEEQDVKALQEERVDSEEIAFENARRLLTKELGPALFESPRCRRDSRLLQNRPDGARGELDPEPDQLALDPPVAPARVLRRA